MSTENQVKRIILKPHSTGQNKFYFNFPVASSSEVKAVHIDEDGNETTPVYTVGSDNLRYGGYIKTDTEYTSGKIVISREPDFKQLLEYVYGEELPLAEQARVLDEITWMCSYLDEIVARGVKSPNLEPDTDLTLNSKNSRKNLNLLTDSNGIPYGGGRLDPSVAPGAFGETLLNVDDIETFLDNMGVSDYARALFRLSTWPEVSAHLNLFDGDNVSITTLFDGSQEELNQFIAKNVMKKVTAQEALQKGDPVSYHFNGWYKAGLGLCGSAQQFSSASGNAQYADIIFLDQEYFVVAWTVNEDNTAKDTVHAQVAKLSNTGIVEVGSEWSKELNLITDDFDSNGVGMCRMTDSLFALVYREDGFTQGSMYILEFDGSGIVEKDSTNIEPSSPQPSNTALSTIYDDYHIFYANSEDAYVYYYNESTESLTLSSGPLNWDSIGASIGLGIACRVSEEEVDLAVNYSATMILSLRFAYNPTDGLSKIGQVTTSTSNANSQFGLCPSGFRSIIVANDIGSHGLITAVRTYYNQTAGSLDYRILDFYASPPEGFSCNGPVTLSSLGRGFALLACEDEGDDIAYQVVSNMLGNVITEETPQVKLSASNPSFLRSGAFSGSFGILYIDSGEVYVQCGAMKKYAAVAKEDISIGLDGLVQFYGILDGLSGKQVGDAVVNYENGSIGIGDYKEKIGRFISSTSLFIT